MDEKTTVIKPRSGWFDINIRELWDYRDLIILFVRRTFVAQYKQTILGPAWAIIQPFFVTVALTVIFGNIAGLAPSGVPAFMFYLSGSVVWGYFSGCLNATSTVFTSNAGIFGKVYFPRMVMPVATVISKLISFAVQFMFFIAFFIYFMLAQGSLRPNALIMLTPLLILQMACLGLGFGIIVSALTTKYKDLVMLVSFGTQIWMYLTPVAYDMKIVPEKYLSLYMLNPMTPIVNTFRYAYLGIGTFDAKYYAISWAVILTVLVIGIVLFSRVEKTFMDTV